MRNWDDLPATMKNQHVRKYYDSINKKRGDLILKRIFDLIAAILATLILSPVFLIISLAIVLDSKGPVFFRQVRVTQYGRRFRIFKFRTMVENAESIGNQVTCKNDMRVTKVGRILRKYRLDEIPQLLNIIAGDMTFVGTRPEVVKYVEAYTDEMMATLLLPAGVTSEASIQFKDEERLLIDGANVDRTYIKVILPRKMKYNLISLENFSFFDDLEVLFKTLVAVFGWRERVQDSAETSL